MTGMVVSSSAGLDGRPQWVSVTAVEVRPGHARWPARANPRQHRVFVEEEQVWICLDERWRQLRRLRYWRQASRGSWTNEMERKLARLERALGEG